jgi:hypothetical protein
MTTDPTAVAGPWGKLHPQPSAAVLRVLQSGAVIPAHPLALTCRRTLDERRQRALTRYYLEAGAGGIAVAVHSTQFAIREPRFGLLRPVLELAQEEVQRFEHRSGQTIVKIAGVCGATAQAIQEAELAAGLGYDAALLSLGGMGAASHAQLLEHCRQVSRTLPIIGFYLQPSVGGRILDVDFWRQFALLPNAIAIKIAPFNRYQTLDVVRAVAEAGRGLGYRPTHAAAPTAVLPDAPPQLEEGIALYTGNDDQIVGDLLGTWEFPVAGQMVRQRIVGGLLGHWAYWTRSAVELLRTCQEANQAPAVPAELLLRNREVTDMNAAVFDPAHNFRGCIPGMHEVLRRLGLLEGTWCLNPDETLSPGQADEITRVITAYPHLVDTEFVAEHRDRWLA